MRSLIAALFFCLSFFALSPAYAGFASDYGRENYSSHVRGEARMVTRGHRSVVVQHYASSASGHLPSACQQAARQGGPCGCWAEAYFFGRTDHVIRIGGRPVNLWLADTWRHVFPRVAPAAQTAAVWPGRHVAPVVATASGKVMVHDSWGDHWVRTAGLVFVDPRARNVADLTP